MNSTHNLIELAKQQCQQDGKKLTPIREQVLNLLIQAKAPLSAYDLLDLYKSNNDSGCQPMTIYRALDFLEDMQLVHRLSSTRQYVICDHLKTDHKTCDHAHHTQFLMCNECGQAHEAPLPDEIWQLIQQQAEKTNFHIKQPNLEIHGTCKNCLKHKN